MSNSFPSGGLLGGSLGLGTEGILSGSSVVLDPAFEALQTPTLAGGTIGRPITRSGAGVWLLDLDLGGQLWRLGTEEVSPLSRARNGRVVYLAGLDDLSFELDSESVSIRARAGAADTWARQRRVLGPIRGRRAVLRYWHRDQVLEDAFVALQGVIAEASFGSVEDPRALELSCARDLRALSREMIPTSQVVDLETWSGLVGTEYPLLGEPYPIVLGCPGAAQGSGDVTPATPGLLILYTGNSRLLIAGHHVAATSVTVFNLVTNAIEVLPVINTFDDRGQPVALVDLDGTTITDDLEHQYAIGWDRATGGGLVHNGREVQGLGDLLEWGADTLSEAVYDHGEMSARRDSLNRYRIDTVINEHGLLWQDWLESNVLSLAELEEVQGPRGVYYQEVRHTTDRRLVRGRLVTGTGRGGYRVERAAPVVESDEEILNAITIAYKPFAAEHGQFVERHTVDPNPRTGVVIEDLLLHDPRCAYSERLFGRREATWETGLTADRATAVAFAAAKAARHALPKLLTAYVGGRDLLDFRKYDVVEVYDTSPGAAFEGDLAIVTGITLVDGSTVQLSVAVDTDPIRSPTVRRT